jgi:hypothetical protein
MQHPLGQSLILHLDKQLLQKLKIAIDALLFMPQTVQLAEDELQSDQLKLPHGSFDGGDGLHSPLLLLDVGFVDGNEREIFVIGLNQNLSEVAEFSREDPTP